jgi:hypothetical protein
VLLWPGILLQGDCANSLAIVACCWAQVIRKLRLAGEAETNEDREIVCEEVGEGSHTGGHISCTTLLSREPQLCIQDRTGTAATVNGLTAATSLHAST